MNTFNGYHINQFNNKCKGLLGDGKALLTHKEMRDLQAEILDLLLLLKQKDQTIADLQTKVVSSDNIEIQLIGDKF